MSEQTNQPESKRSSYSPIQSSSTLSKHHSDSPNPVELKLNVKKRSSQQFNSSTQKKPKSLEMQTPDKCSDKTKQQSITSDQPGNEEHSFSTIECDCMESNNKLKTMRFKHFKNDGSMTLINCKEVREFDLIVSLNIRTDEYGNLYTENSRSDGYAMLYLPEKVLCGSIYKKIISDIKKQTSQLYNVNGLRDDSETQHRRTPNGNTHSNQKSECFVSFETETRNTTKLLSELFRKLTLCKMALGYKINRYSSMDEFNASIASKCGQFAFSCIDANINNLLECIISIALEIHQSCRWVFSNKRSNSSASRPNLESDQSTTEFKEREDQERCQTKSWNFERYLIQEDQRQQCGYEQTERSGFANSQSDKNTEEGVQKLVERRDWKKFLVSTMSTCFAKLMESESLIMGTPCDMYERFMEFSQASIGGQLNDQIRTTMNVCESLYNVIIRVDPGNEREPQRKTQKQIAYENLHSEEALCNSSQTSSHLSVTKTKPEICLSSVHMDDLESQIEITNQQRQSSLGKNSDSNSLSNTESDYNVSTKQEPSLL